MAHAELCSVHKQVRKSVSKGTLMLEPRSSCSTWENSYFDIYVAEVVQLSISASQQTIIFYLFFNI